MADEKSMLDKVVDRTNAVLEKPVGVVAAVVNFFMRDGTLAALGREAVKDVQDTFHEVAFGQGDHSREPGGPLTPLFSDIAAAGCLYPGHAPPLAQSDCKRRQGRCHGARACPGGREAACDDAKRNRQ